VYWQPIFFVVTLANSRTVKTSSNQTQEGRQLRQACQTPALNPTYDLLIDTRIMPQFFSSFTSIRGNRYTSNLGFDVNVDFIMDDLFHLPCFGPSSPESFPLIFSATSRAWNEAYRNLALNFIFLYSLVSNTKFFLS
jgi:hypothetical protein